MVLYCIAETPLYRAIYNFEYTTDSIRNIKRNDCLYLDLNINHSLCYSKNTYQYDSLMSTPLGSKIWEELFNKAIDQEGYRATSFPKKRTKFKILKNWVTGIARIQDEIDLDKYEYIDSLNKIHWNICDSVTSIAGYSSMLAIGNFHGRTWKVWFTTDLPWQDGPWMLSGLPGLIIKAYDTSNLYSFNLIELEEIRNLPDYWNNDTKKTNRKDFLRKKYKTLVNSVNSFNAEFGTSITNANDTRYLEGLEPDFKY
ncbi:MAG: GLPGLI family protein [Muribaculum sp.]|nr:GLPGLI family protein [Muribaculum sp.]